MKVALLLTGHSRTYEQTINNLKKNILDNYDVDIYFFCWNKNQGMTMNNAEFPHQNFNTNSLIEAYSKVGNLVKYHFEDVDNYKQTRFQNINFLSREDDVFKTDPSAIWHGSFWVERLRDQWYGIKKAFSLIKDPSIYDCILRVRFDFDLYNIKLTNLDFVIHKDDLNIAMSGGFKYTDLFAYGIPSKMKKYCNMFDHIPSMYYDLNINISHATKMVKFYMEEYGDDRVITHIDDSIVATILR